MPCVIIDLANDNYYQLEIIGIGEYLCFKEKRIDDMSLQSAKIGYIYKIISMSLDMATMRRLEALGLTKGTNIKVLNRNSGGSVILIVRGSRLALGNKITEAIHIKEVS